MKSLSQISFIAALTVLAIAVHAASGYRLLKTIPIPGGCSSVAGAKRRCCW